MNVFFLDASALVKRYANEVGSPLLDHLFHRTTVSRRVCLMLGAAEVLATLVRKRNGGRLTASLFSAAVGRLRAEVLLDPAFVKVPATNAVINASLPFLDRYGINSTDGLLLQTAQNLASALRPKGDDLVLASSDRRLVRAAQREGTLTFDPKTQSQGDLDALIGP